MKHFEAHIDTTAYTQKPTGLEVGAIVNRITKDKMETNAVGLMAALGNGHTVCPGIIKGGAKKDSNVTSVGFILVDIDKGLSLQEALDNPFTQQHAAFYYKTFGYSEEQEKFRIAFILNEPIADEESDLVKHAYKAMYAMLQEVYGNKLDKSMATPSKIIYGTCHAPEVINLENTLPYDPDWKYRELAARTYEQNDYNKEFCVDKSLVVNDIAKLISEKNWRALRQAFKGHYAGSAPTYFGTLDYLRKLPIHEIFDIGYETNVHDIFHDESKPSARVYKVGEIYRYHCFSESHEFDGDLIDIVCALADISFTEARKKLLSVFEVYEDPTDKQRAIYRQINELIEILDEDNAEIVKKHYPGIRSKLWRKRYDIMNLLRIMKDSVVYDFKSKEVRVAIYMSHEKIMNRLNIKSVRTVERLLDLMRYAEIVKALPDEEVPTQVLNMLNASKNNRRFKGAYAKRANVYEVVELDNYVENIEERCLKMKQDGHTAAANTTQMLLANHGEEAAKKMRVQNIIGLTEKFSKNEQLAIRALNKIFEKQDYATWKQIHVMMKRMNAGSSRFKLWNEETLKGFRVGIQRVCNCTEKSANKSLIEDLGASKHVRSRMKVLVKNK